MYTAAVGAPLLEATLHVLAGLAMGPTRVRRVAGLLLACGAFLACWLVPAELQAERFLVALVGFLCLMRTIDLARDRRDWSAGWRVFIVLSSFDARLVRRARPALDSRVALAAIGYAALTAGAVEGILATRSLPDGAPRLLLRWLGGAVLQYAAFDAVVAGVRAGYRLVGIDIPNPHRTPIAARTVGEFWGERWNLAVHEWLRRHLFLPLARRHHPYVGLAAAFGCSTAIHAWLSLVPLGGMQALSMGAFFTVQGVALVAERWLRVSHWPRPLAHAWTVCALLVPAPLFVEPMLRIVGL